VQDKKRATVCMIITRGCFCRVGNERAATTPCFSILYHRDQFVVVTCRDKRDERPYANSRVSENPHGSTAPHHGSHTNGTETGVTSFGSDQSRHFIAPKASESARASRASERVVTVLSRKERRNGRGATCQHKQHGAVPTNTRRHRSMECAWSIDCKQPDTYWYVRSRR